MNNLGTAAEFSTISTHNGYLIGVATLNRPEILNSLTLDMALLLTRQLKAWQDDDDVVAVILQSAGDKSFCAGGDLQSLYKSMLQVNEKSASVAASTATVAAGVSAAAINRKANPYAVEYFKVEYTLDYMIHTYLKPIIVWGQGIVMGGGIGLLSGCSHRIASTDVRMAMPEVTIGLFPDVGGSWLLSKLPGSSGKFLAATGAIINSQDALFTRMVDYVMAADKWPEFLILLQKADWQKDAPLAVHNDLIQTSLLSIASNQVTEAGPLQRNLNLINQICSWHDYRKIYQEIAQLIHHDDVWLAKAANTMLHGSPLSVALALELQSKVKNMSLAQVFGLEYAVVLHCSSDGIFQEGIRALIIEKDKKPHWPYTSIESVPHAVVQSYFDFIWPEIEPLKLEQTK